MGELRKTEERRELHALTPIFRLRGKFSVR